MQFQIALGGYGGGVIIITATSLIVVNGSLDSNGENGALQGAAGGSGVLFSFKLHYLVALAIFLQMGAEDHIMSIQCVVILTPKMEEEGLVEELPFTSLQTILLEWYHVQVEPLLTTVTMVDQEQFL